MILGVTVVAGPSLIVSVIALIGLAIYQRVRQKTDDSKFDAALDSIRRCPKCNQLVAPDSSTCRHCRTLMPPAP